MYMVYSILYMWFEATALNMQSESDKFSFMYNDKSELISLKAFYLLHQYSLQNLGQLFLTFFVDFFYQI